MSMGMFPSRSPSRGMITKNTKTMSRSHYAVPKTRRTKRK